MTDRPQRSDDARRNRAYWDRTADDYQQWYGRDGRDDTSLYWAWPSYPEAQLRVLGDVADRDVLELGCGAAQWSIALARHGARTVGLDLSARQLRHARQLMAAASVDVPLIQASAEAVPLADTSFDVVFAEYGACAWSDPYCTIPEAARLLRPNGLLAFMTNSPLIDLCWLPGADRIGEQLQRGYFGLHRLDLDDHVEYQLPYGEWIRLFRASGLIVEDLLELRAPEEQVGDFRTDDEHAWARRWPAYNVWRVRRLLDLSP
jgi:SAM-dependent methyltransferase